MKVQIESVRKKKWESGTSNVSTYSYKGGI